MKKYNEAGFTLIELIIVVAIIGIMASVATFSIAHFTSYRLHTYGQELLNDLRYVRMKKMATGEMYQIKIQSSSYSVRIGPEQLKKVEIKSPYAIGTRDSHDHSINNIIGAIFIYFDYNGTPTNSRTFVIYNTKDTSEAVDISIAVASGRVIIKE